MHQDQCVEIARQAAVACHERHDYMPATELLAEVWQPIETAPKDGTEVLLIATMGSMLTPRPRTVVGSWSRGWLAFSNTLSHVTHWQPLPAPPAQNGEGG